MMYKVGDRVKIKSIDWYNENKDEDGVVPCGEYNFVFEMSTFCGKILTIDVDFEDGTYLMKEDIDGFVFADEMIEGLVEEETKPKFKVGDKITNGKDTLTILTLSSDRYVVEDTFGECGTLYFNFVDDWKIVEEENLKSREDDIEKDMGEHQKIVDEIMDIQGIKPIEAEMEEVWYCPEGYIFKDENGNIINTTKIVLEKKKKEYPKTYEECAKIMNCPIAGPNGWLFNFDANIKDPYYRKIDILMGKFTRLLICRDAYWKIAGEEMGLGKHWEPDYNEESYEQGSPIKYVIYYTGTNITKGRKCTPSYVLSFPTEEMRDAFKENFDPEIEICKELL